MMERSAGEPEVWATGFVAVAGWASAGGTQVSGTGADGVKKRGGVEIGAEKRTTGGLESSRIVPVRIVEGIKEAQFVGDVPGPAEIGHRCYATPEHRAGICLIAQIGARFTPKDSLVVAENVGVTARVAEPRREIQFLPVIGLHAELLGRRVRARAPVVQIAIEIRAAGGIHKARSEERAAARLICGGIERNA
jgi:hypothetical protein